MSSIAIITARGGSKRIPRKNIKEFCGKPILLYSIEAALKSQLFDEVMVSTDDREIAELAKMHGAKVPFLRSEETANDFATTAEVIYEVIDRYRQQGDYFSTICCIYPTAPFITPEKLCKGFSLLDKDTDEVLPVVPFSFPPQRCIILEDHMAKMKWEEHKLTRSQDLEKWYHDCGQFYILRTESFLKQKSIMMERTVPLIMSDLEVQDIDNEEDWLIAEMKFRLMMDKVKRN